MKKNYVIIVASVFTFCSCSKMLDVDGPKARLQYSDVFADNVSASAAITGIYQEMDDISSFASGGDFSITQLAGMSADELVDFYRTNQDVIDMEQNNIMIENPYVESLWNTMYKVVFQANSAFEGLTASQTLTPEVKNQLLGEALFIRAFTHFYLVNLFGEVPVITTTSYESNAKAKRQSVDTVYNQIIKDLVEAEELMGENYPTSERVRPTKYVAAALLARVYLFRGDWENAEVQASLLLDNNSEFELLSDLNTVFLKNSREAVWQLFTSIPDYPTWDGYFLTVTPSGPINLVMNETLAQSFNPADARLSNWVGTYDTGNGIIHFPSKYKGDSWTFSATEYSMVLRLAEQYLIRAEARARQNNLTSAIEDIDKVRARAMLPRIADTNAGINQDELIDTILDEKRHELFTEWGHRWLDLKRTNKATEMLTSIKSGWSETDQLYPIPALELQRNTNLGNQNPGY